MKELSSFFKKFEKLAVPNKEVREVCATFCTKILNKDISISTIKPKRQTIYLNLPPMLRGEVLMHKVSLLEEVNATLHDTKKHYTEVR